MGIISSDHVAVGGNTYLTPGLVVSSEKYSRLAVNAQDWFQLAAIKIQAKNRPTCSGFLGLMYRCFPGGPESKI